ncbi:MAG: type IV toxin-antitoxin system AbiEi family antitoxin [Parasphingorhabdus sp.]|uniref:type IV toxin-antitoxin system AbiEi family antitoxin n=1 Tax=Parasphingorhabdus sp. TaxID=2709688 RepID=UPI003001322B
MKIEEEARNELVALLSAIDAIKIINIKREPASEDVILDFLVELEHARKKYHLACEVKSNGQPRHIRNAIFQLHHFARNFGNTAYPVIIAPYLSPKSQDLCRAERFGYLDFVGNVHLEFGSVYIDRKTDETPKGEQRSLRSIFKPKAANILRNLLNDPERRWRVAKLAETANASVGHVSEVGQALREREWAVQSRNGLYLTDPDGLLDAWSQEYEQPDGERVELYTHLHGSALINTIEELMADYPDPKIVFGSYTAADWLGPYARAGKTYLYADERGLGALQKRLNLQQPLKGPNIEICVPNEDGVLNDIERFSKHVICTSAVQTYLDLMNSGERGREAAEHLRKAKLQWQ